jgi:hypothetical protein
VAQLYPQALGSLFVASYDSQGYGGGIWTRLYAERPSSYTHKLQLLTCSAYSSLGTDSTETPFFCSYVTVSVETCLFALPLLSNGCCMFAYFAVVAQKRVYMSQYIMLTKCIALLLLMEARGSYNYYHTKKVNTIIRARDLCENIKIGWSLTPILVLYM